MAKNSNETIIKALDLARELIILADEGDASREDVGCGVLFGTLRDCGYKIRRTVKQEKICVLQ